MLSAGLNGSEAMPPFVLLDDARLDGASDARLYTKPIALITAYERDEISACFERLKQQLAAGHHVAGYLSYEAGMGLDSAWRGAKNEGVSSDDSRSKAKLETAQPAAPILWFGVFESCQRIAPDEVPNFLPDPRAAWVGAPEPLCARADYLAAIDQLLRYIEAGDMYQANFTFPAEVAFAGNPLAIYARLRETAKAGYGAFVWTGAQAIASLSPELFFSLRGQQIMARPMKGTAARHADAQQDKCAALQLARDEKQRAENLMIVDLIRNDLARVAEAGTVKVPKLFRVESFPTIHQMVSDVAAQLPPEAGAVELLRAAFPCGSITGAPKVRAMEIIDEMEGQARGVYTGSIGFIEPSGDAAFNVAIRTLLFPPSSSQMGQGQAGKARMGLGSGIVADSQPDAEWRECLAKGNFVKAASENFDLLETMAFDPIDGLQRLERHLARMAESAAALSFHFSRHDARNMLQAATFRLRQSSKVRMRLGRSGAIAVEIAPLPAQAAGLMSLSTCPAPHATDDYRLRHKTSLRCAYEQARKNAGTPEVVFIDGNGWVTEGSFSNIFLEKEGRLLTPPLELGLLPGVLRAELLAEGKAIESPLTKKDLENGFFIGNSLRGLLPATLMKSFS